MVAGGGGGRWGASFYFAGLMIPSDCSVAIT